MFTPTDKQVDKVREIAGENNSVLVSALIAKLTDGAWARAKEFITAWDEEFPPGDPGLSIRGGSDGLYLLPTEAGNDIRGRMRLLLGLPEFRDASLTGVPVTQSVPTRWVF